MKDLTGRRYGRLTIIRFSERRGSNYVWWYRCDCGTEKKIQANGFLAGAVQSCGCFNRERVKETHTTHGRSHSPEYNSWHQMLHRCTDPKDDSYRFYGAKGISVCDRWLKFEHFLEDMGERPKGTSLDRVDPYQGYEPSNCRWLTHSRNCAVKRETKLFFHKDAFRTVGELAGMYKIKRTTLHMRLKYGWTLERALGGDR